MTKFLVTSEDLEEFNLASNQNNPINIFWIGLLNIIPKNLKSELNLDSIKLAPYFELNNETAYKFELKSSSKQVKEILEKIIIISRK